MSSQSLGLTKKWAEGKWESEQVGRGEDEEGRRMVLGAVVWIEGKSYGSWRGHPFLVRRLVVRPVGMRLKGWEKESP